MSEKRLVTLTEVRAAADRVAEQANLKPWDKLYGIPRGGIPAAFAVARSCGADLTDDLNYATHIIDDIYDSGATAKRYREKYNRPVLVLFDKTHERWKGKWLVMPWERAEDDQSADDMTVRLLQYIGEDVTREGLRETPKRVAAYWREATSGFLADQDTVEAVLKCFEDGADGYDEMVFQGSIPFFSTCEHHLVPFFGVVHIGYIPTGKIVGLSKFARLVELFARRLQVQERLTQQIAQVLDEHLSPKGVGVVIRARHLCMEARGVQKIGTVTYTSALRGVIKTAEGARGEFLEFVKLADARNPNI